MKVTLTEWADKHLSKPPGINTLRKYAREGRFEPEAEFIAGCYRVQEDAELKSTDARSRMQKLRLAAKMKDESIDLSDIDPLALEIVSSVA